MPESPGKGSEDQDPRTEVERLRQEVDRLWSRDVARQLKLSEAKYRALVEGSSDFIYVLDRDGHFTFANREVEHLLGYKPEEIIGRHFSEILHPQDLESMGRAFHERRTGERATRRLELRLRSRGGDTRDVEVDIRHFSLSASGIYQDQDYIGTHGVARDITERKYQETKYRALLQVREAIWDMARVDDIEQVLGSIRTSLQTMGVSYGEVAVHVLDMSEPPMLTLYTSRGTDTIAEQGEWMVTDTEAFATSIVDIWRRGQQVYNRDLERSGSSRDAEHLECYYGRVRSLVDEPFSHGVLTLTSDAPTAFNARNLSFLHELAGILSEGFRRMEDLQELTLSERRYRTLVETPNLVVMLIDAQGSFLYISPQLRDWLGYAPQDFYADAALLGRIAHPEDRESVETFLDSREAPALRDLEFRWYSRDSRELWAAAALFPIYESEEDEALGRVHMVQVVIQDITERKQVEALIKNSLEEKEVLLKEIHHRVKNNLQIISSLLHLQSRDLGDEAVRRIFDDSQNRINSMALIHEELYNAADLARIDFSEYARNLVHKLLDSFAIDIERVGLEIEVDAAPLNLDRAIPLGLIINELVSNSLKYAFPGGRRGCIRVRLSTAAGQRFTLVVSDDGSGLPAEIDIVNPRTLGLRLVHTLAQQLRARVHLDRESGTRFTISRE